MNGGSDSMCRLGQFPTAGDTSLNRPFDNNLTRSVRGAFSVNANIKA